MLFMNTDLLLLDSVSLVVIEQLDMIWGQVGE